jgi:hypothetical protein
MKAPVSTAIAIAFGVIVLLGFFFPIGVLTPLNSFFVRWAVILTAVALFVGIGNLFYVHFVKITARQADSFYSLVLVISLAFTLTVVGWLGPTHPVSLWIFNNVQLPVESSLLAILTVILAYAAIRLLRRRLNLLSVVFLLTALVILLATGTRFGLDVPGLDMMSAWISRVPAVAGARGILFGIVLGVIATAFRILAGIERPYAG